MTVAESGAVAVPFSSAGRRVRGRFRDTTGVHALVVWAAVVAALGGCSRDATRPTVSLVAEAKGSESDTFRLRIVVTGNGQVKPGGLGEPCSDDCTFHALRGKTVELKATGKEDVFHQWSTRCGREATCKVKMASDLVIRAEFGLDRYEPAWAVPLTSSECVVFNWLAAGEQVVVSGGFWGTATLGPFTLTNTDRDDGIVTALRRGNGDVAWAQRFGGKGFEWVSSPQVLPGGRVVASLFLSGGVSATTGQASAPVHEGRIIWMDRDTGAMVDSVQLADKVDAIRRLDDGGVIALIDGHNSFTVSRFSATGPRTPLWSKVLRASDVVSVRPMAIGRRGEVFVAGNLKGTPQFTAAWKGIPPLTADWKPFFVRLDGATGVVRSARWIGWQQKRHVLSMASDGRHVVLVGGVERDRDTDAFVTAVSLDGVLLWDRVYKGRHRLGGSFISSVDVSGEGIAVAGSTRGEITAGKLTIGKSGQNTAFIIEYSAKGDVVWSFAQPRDRGEAIAIARDQEGDLYVTGSFQTAFDFAGQTIWPHPSRRHCGSAYVAKFARTGDRSGQRSPSPQAAP